MGAELGSDQAATCGRDSRLCRVAHLERAAEYPSSSGRQASSGCYERRAEANECLRFWLGYLHRRRTAGTKTGSFHGGEHVVEWEGGEGGGVIGHRVGDDELASVHETAA